MRGLSGNIQLHNFISRKFKKKKNGKNRLRRLCPDVDARHINFVQRLRIWCVGVGAGTDLLLLYNAVMIIFCDAVSAKNWQRTLQYWCGASNHNVDEEQGGGGGAAAAAAAACIEWPRRDLIHRFYLFRSFLLLFCSFRPGRFDTASKIWSDICPDCIAEITKRHYLCAAISFIHECQQIFGSKRMLSCSVGEMRNANQCDRFK